MVDPHEVTRMFERALCEYTGAKYCVATTSCTTALQLCLSEWGEQTIRLPKRTYVGVAQAVLNAGHKFDFIDHRWAGEYQLAPLPIWDCARWLRAGMYVPGQVMCLSFHWSKHLAIGQGGAILVDNPNMAEWLRWARFDGRKVGGAANDIMVGRTLHAYMMPRDAADGLTRLALLPRYNFPLPWGPGTSSDYPDLSEIFK